MPRQRRRRGRQLKPGLRYWPGPEAARAEVVLWRTASVSFMQEKDIGRAREPGSLGPQGWSTESEEYLSLRFLTIGIVPKGLAEDAAQGIKPESASAKTARNGSLLAWEPCSWK